MEKNINVSRENGCESSSVLSSNPQINGRAEAAVKSTKCILLENINLITGALDTRFFL